jgi:hypothetical protein
MEDLFSVGHSSLGLDGQGHIGYADQPGLAPFGPDVFTSPQGHDEGPGSCGHSPWGVPLAGLAAAGALPGIGMLRRRRRSSAGMVPIRPADFTIIDELGRLHHPRVTAPGGPPPEEAAPGRTVTLIVRDVLPVGSGMLRWSPGTARPVVSWDFDVVID